MEMPYFWLLDGGVQEYSSFHYNPGHKNLDDSNTKVFIRKDAHHVQSFYVHKKLHPEN